MSGSLLQRGAIALSLVAFSFVGSAMAAENYKIDPAHSFIEFSIHHLGISMLKGRFDTLSGKFSYDADKPDNSSITVEVETASINSNHAERDTHLRGKDFLDVKQFPKATFVSSKFSEKDGKGLLTGQLTLHGVTREVMIPVSAVGHGNDPWGGYRRGYIGILHLKRSDFGLSYNLGPAAEEMDLELSIEGIRE